MKFDPIKLYQAIKSFSPDAQYSCDGDCYEGLTWYNDEYKPTEEEVVQKIAELEYQEEVNEYQRQRAAEYPSYPDQFDKIYHSGVNAWKSQIKQIKDKYPKQTMDTTELQTRKDKSIFDLQTERYIKATERLSQYILSEGRPELTEDVIVSTEEVWNEETEEYDTVNIAETVITQTAIDALPETIEVTETDFETGESTTSTVLNPVIVKDEEERAAAQLLLDNTPQSVIDSLS